MLPKINVVGASCLAFPSWVVDIRTYSVVASVAAVDTYLILGIEFIHITASWDFTFATFVAIVPWRLVSFLAFQLFGF